MKAISQKNWWKLLAFPLPKLHMHHTQVNKKQLGKFIRTQIQLSNLILIALSQVLQWQWLDDTWYNSSHWLIGSLKINSNSNNGFYWSTCFVWVIVIGWKATGHTLMSPFTLLVNPFCLDFSLDAFFSFSSSIAFCIWV